MAITGELLEGFHKRNERGSVIAFYKEMYMVRHEAVRADGEAVTPKSRIKRVEAVSNRSDDRERADVSCGVHGDAVGVAARVVKRLQARRRASLWSQAWSARAGQT